jgi:hypothetical protein
MPCIKAGTSEHGACPKCGAPWERIVEASGWTICEGGWSAHEGDGKSTRYACNSSTTDGTYKREQKGWQPTCDCDVELNHETDLRPCVVLDPFHGSGTVSIVAELLERASIGCELNPKYTDIAIQRWENQTKGEAKLESRKEL